MDHLEQLSIDTARVSNWAFLGDMKNLNWLSICSTGSDTLPNWLLPEKFPDLNVLNVDDSILNKNHKLVEQILPILEERREKMKTEPKFFEPRINFPGVLEFMEPVETYDG